MKISITELRNLWSNGVKLKIGNKLYRIGRMSYGDYFAEPGKERSEREPFNKGTRWAKVIEGQEYYYNI